MNASETDRLISMISWGYTQATVLSANNDLITLLLRTPSLKEKAMSATVYSTEYQRAITIGLLAEDDILENLIALGRWDKNTDAEIAGLEKDIHTIRRGLLGFLFDNTKLEKSRSLLRRAENALLTRLSRKHDLVQDSAEAHAMVCQQRYLIGCITEREDGSPFWINDKSFEDYQDIELIKQLCSCFFVKSRLPTKIVREVARSQQWRAYWEVAKNTNDLFDSPVAAWSWNQRELAYWSTIYDSVYEAYERPPRRVIVDDDLLDSWFIRQSEKSDERTKGGVAPQANKKGRNEEFIFADETGAKHVYDMNSPEARARIRAKQKRVSDAGHVREQDMPDSQQEMRQQVMDGRQSKIKDIRRR